MIFHKTLFHMVVTPALLGWLALTCAAPAEATLIEGSCDGAIDSSVTCDTDTGLEWLDLGLTTGLSAAEILGGAGGLITEWRYASFSQGTKVAAQVQLQESQGGQ